ncbi:long-chain-fatty-acid--CoA ligase [Ancylobacter sp. G4_0304]
MPQASAVDRKQFYAPHGISGAMPEGATGIAGAWPQTLPELLDWAVEQHANRPALDFIGRVWTYRQLGRMVDQVAAGLQQIGVKRETRIGLCLPNVPYYVAFYFAALRLGAVVVNFNPLYTAHEISTQVRDSRTEVMVTLDLERMYRPIASIAQESGLSRIIVCSLAAALPKMKSAFFRLLHRREIARIGRGGRHMTFDALVALGRGKPAPRTQVGLNDLAVLQYTGGTTGVPKGAMLTHASLIANARQLVVFAGPGTLRPGVEKVLCVLPLFHVFAMTVSMNVAIGIGAQMILLPQFKLDDLLRTMERCKPTVFPAVPTLYGALNAAADTRKLDITSVRLCISGGAPLPLEVRMRFESLTGCRLSEGYGLSECSPVVTVNPLDGRPGRAGSAGLALPGTIIEIRDPDNPGVLLGPGERGEVCVRGPQVMLGYWGRPEDTRAVMIDGALRTGDIGYVDEDGFLFLVDRIKDLIICSGYNVYPRVIEEALHAHEAVAEVIAIGVPDPYRGESPKAFVTLKPGFATTPEELLAFVAERISKIEIPRAIEIREKLPKTLIGKLSRKELVAEELLRAKAAASVSVERGAQC